MELFVFLLVVFVVGYAIKNIFITKTSTPEDKPMPRGFDVKTDEERYRSGLHAMKGPSVMTMDSLANRVSQHVSVKVVHESQDRYNDPEVKIIRDEIRTAVSLHREAVSVLQALARLDGQTSDTERRLVFAFLQRQGEALILEKHGPWFSTSRAGEWHRAITPEELWPLLDALRPYPALYRADVVATAESIMAVGGKPKPSKLSAMAEIRKLTQ